MSAANKETITDSAIDQRPMIRVLTCGSVDDGKSTLIGRLLYDSKSLLMDQLESLKSDSKSHGTVEGGGLDFALLLDGLSAEREQGITIDVAYRFFSTDQCNFIIADTPGHEQYTRNMATGASTADAAILLIDARNGIGIQTRRHSQILSLLGVKHVVLAVNKMDILGFDQKIFEDIVKEFRLFADDLGFLELAAIPLSARFGDNLFAKSDAAPWYKGQCLMDWLHGLVPIMAKQEANQQTNNENFKMQVQWVNRPNLDFRGFAGTIAAGKLKLGDMVLVQPTNQRAEIKEILIGNQSSLEAEKGQAITLRLDREVDISRGDVLSNAKEPAQVSDQFSAHLVWMDSVPMLPERRYYLKFGTRTVAGAITDLKYRLDANHGEKHAAKSLELNEIGLVNIAIDRPIVYLPYKENKRLGSFIIIDRISNATIGAGMIEHGLRRAENIQWQPIVVSQTQRAAIKNQKPITLWFTGLSGSGKSTIANLLEQKLAHSGYHTMLLDGDNVRHGLNRDLGFTDVDRVENVRRVAEVAGLMLNAGLITLVSFISPFNSERQMARDLMGSGNFWEIYVNSSLEACERRDVKGLYALARSGKLPHFTGISSPYEAPINPEYEIKTAEQSAERSAQFLFDQLKAKDYLL